MNMEANLAANSLASAADVGGQMIGDGVDHLLMGDGDRFRASPDRNVEPATLNRESERKASPFGYPMSRRVACAN